LYFFQGVLEAQSGKTGFTIEMPASLVTAAHNGTSTDPLTVQPQYAGYQGTFKKLWGLAG
jgi:hypothetical protein